MLEGGLRPTAARLRRLRILPSWLGWAVGLIVSLVLAAGSSLVVRSYPSRELDVNMLFVPPAAMVRGGAAGYENVIADSLWLTLLQYYGERFGYDHPNMQNLDAAFGLITDLDAQFWFAYWLGAWALSDDKQPANAIKLLEKGERANPTYLHYPYLQGFIRFLYLHDYAGAAVCFERAATREVAEWEDQKRFARTMAARMYQKTGQDDLALQIWQNLLKNAKDKTIQAIARRNVERIEAEMQGRQPRVFKPGTMDPGETR